MRPQNRLVHAQIINSWLNCKELYFHKVIWIASMHVPESDLSSLILILIYCFITLSIGWVTFQEECCKRMEVIQHRHNQPHWNTDSKVNITCLTLLNITLCSVKCVCNKNAYYLRLYKNEIYVGKLMILFFNGFILNKTLDVHYSHGYIYIYINLL